MPRATVPANIGTIEIEYETFGSTSDPTLLLVMGFTAQMIAWSDDFCRALADLGLHVVRFDNRDCGLSSKLDGVMVDPGPVMAAVFANEPAPPVPYTLSDMARDAIGLLDHLAVVDRIAGVRIQHFVAGVHHGLDELRDDGLASRLHDDVRRREAKPATRTDVVGERLAQLRNAGRRAVAGLAVGDRLVHRLDDVLRGGDVQVTEVERKDAVALRAPFGGGERNGERRLRSELLEPCCKRHVPTPVIDL